VLDKVNIISFDSDWVRYGQGRNDKFRNVRTAGGFVINAILSCAQSTSACKLWMCRCDVHHGDTAGVLLWAVLTTPRAKALQDEDAQRHR